MQDDESAVSHTRLAYLPALDGMRACAVLAVMMFHGGIPHMDGGFMGVDAFFVLSGFLITSLLIGEWRQTLTIKLGAFWARRARRLLPALLLMLLFVAFFASVIVPKGTYGALRLDALATLLYVSNWHFILVNSNYFNETSASSPLLHTWSLAVEEQFYVIWPLVVLGVHALHPQPAGAVRLVLRGGHRRRPSGCTTCTTAASTPTGPISGPTRARSASSSAARWRWGSCSSRSSRHEEGRLAKGELWRPESTTGRLFCGVLGVIGAAGAIALWVLTTSTSTFPYSGGFFLIGLSVASVILAAVAAPRSIVPRLLSLVRRCATWAGSPTGSTSGTGPSSFGSTTPGRASTGTSSSRARPRHLRRLGGVLPPRRAPDPHGHVRQPVAGVAGRARRCRCRAGGRDRGHDGNDGRRQHGAAGGRRRHDGVDVDRPRRRRRRSVGARPCGSSSSATRWP